MAKARVSEANAGKASMGETISSRLLLAQPNMAHAPKALPTVVSPVTNGMVQPNIAHAPKAQPTVVSPVTYSMGRPPNSTAKSTTAKSSTANMAKANIATPYFPGRAKIST